MSTEPHYAARRTSSAKLSFAFSLRPGTVGQAGRKQRLYTSVDADRPRTFPAITRGKILVEPPGIAPGSSPLISRAFIPIVGRTRRFEYRTATGGFEGPTVREAWTADES